MSPIVIDGSYGEGGGQILRYAAALAAVVGEEVRVVNIRSKRPNPGLRPQHIGGLKILHQVCGGTVEGLRVGSMEVTMRFGRPKPGEYFYDVGTAGSVTLVMQTLLPALAYHGGEYEVTIVGGTDVKWSPTTDYFRHVVLHNLRLVGVEAELEVVKRGYYPRGGGRVVLRVRDGKLRSSSFSRAEVARTEVVSVASNLPAHVAERQARAIIEGLRREGVSEVERRVERLGPDRAFGPGSSVLVYSETRENVRCGGDSIGEKGKPAERVGQEALEKYLEWYRSSAALDTFMSDMIIPFLFIAEGHSSYTAPKMTLHMDSALYVASRITGRSYRVSEERGAVRVEV